MMQETEIQNKKIETNSNTQIQNPKRYDLEERTFRFAKNVRLFVKKIPRTLGNLEDVKQILRSSGSVGANYVEANGALGKRDLCMRIKICRKESKESRYWLLLLDLDEDEILEAERNHLIKESTEFIKIFSTILRRCS